MCAEWAEVGGGQSSLGAERTGGSTVTGVAGRRPGTIAGARPGDGLIRAKPVGTGVILAAEMAGAAPGEVVARALLGATLVRQIDGARVSGTIVEIEAYSTPDDLASHGYAKRTGRNWVMWDAPGHAYVYLIYGMYWLLNIVCEPVDRPAAVLIRAIEPREGLPVMAANRAGQPPRRFKVVGEDDHWLDEDEQNWHGLVRVAG